MINTVQKVAVLGAGVMGSGIAALLAGVGMRVTLLDVIPAELDEKEKAKGLTEESPAFRNRLTALAMERIKNPKTGMLYRRENAKLITTGNLTDDLHLVADCDWILEVVVERLDVKQALMAEVAKYRKPGSIVSTNTSGVSIAAIVRDLPEEFRQHFLGTHFFNPPRYMRLFEMIPIAETLPGVVEAMAGLAEKVLGKGVVYAKDTPNFIGNRIGTFSSVETLRLMDRYGYDIPTVDQLTGPVLGRPKSATFRTGDMVGLDIFVNVAANVVNNVDDADEQARFTLLPWVGELMATGAMGDKTKKGFYTRTPDRKMLFWDYRAGEYKPFTPTPPEAVSAALKTRNPCEAIVWGEERENLFAWELVKSLLLYSASKIPEITEDYKMIDRAMIWGYNWKMGPFGLWDAIGFERSVARMREEGEVIPAWVERKLRDDGAFYDAAGEATPYIKLDDKNSPPVLQNDDAVLRDIGDGVLLLEFRTKGNSISTEVQSMMVQALEEMEKGWLGMVIGNRGKNFSAGANLKDMLAAAQNKEWERIRASVEELQTINMNLKYASKPVVAAPFGMTVGGGAECVMHAASACPHAETYMGLVEAGVGLVPGAGGCKEFLVRQSARAGGASRQALMPAVQNAWRAIAMASVSSSAFDAVDKGMMNADTRVIMNPDALIDEAKDLVFQLAQHYMPPVPATVTLLGDYGRAVLQLELDSMLGGGFVSEYDAHIAGKLAFILTGGNAVCGTQVDEWYILELEREAFVSLCGEERTQQRIAHMLQKGKPLRN